jgi:rare lipoprotein A (peptidoglycan hydrolase)
MVLRRQRPVVLVAAALACTVALAAPAAASSGGASPGGAATAPTTAAPAPAPPAEPGSAEPGSFGGADAGGVASGGAAPGAPVASASANGITISARSAALLRRRSTVAGSAPLRLHEVRVEQLRNDGAWSEVATATVGADGSFHATWRPRSIGPQRLRAVAAGGAMRAADAPPQVAVTVYRPAMATWYGPGSYGTKTACGVRLRKTTIGVAHRTLPCGTQVELYYRGRTLVVPVIDRGPFAAGRSWDLTKATHAALGGDDGLIAVGALRLQVPRMATPFKAPPIRQR